LGGGEPCVLRGEGMHVLAGEDEAPPKDMCRGSPGCTQGAGEPRPQITPASGEEPVPRGGGGRETSMKH